MTSYSKLLCQSWTAKKLPFDAFECMAYEPIDTSSYCVYKSGPFQTYGQNLFAALAAESLNSIQQFIQLLRARR
jgi:hypothetical protein